jgi:hypothetical protein
LFNRSSFLNIRFISSDPEVGRQKHFYHGGSEVKKAKIIERSRITRTWAVGRRKRELVVTIKNLPEREGKTVCD